MVLAVHATGLLVSAGQPDLPVWGLIRSHLNSGFQLFFVISGFLIAGPYLRNLIRGTPLPDGGAYALRRVARVGPAFWAVLAVFALVTPAVDWGSLLVHATFIHDAVPHQSGAILPVAWTLGIEACFYAFVPLVAVLVRKLRPAVSGRQLTRWIVIAWCASALWELGFSLAFHGPYGSAAVSPRDDTLKLFSISLPGLFYMFCPGLLVAIWCRDDARLRVAQRFPGVLVIAGCGAWLGAAAIEAAVGGSVGACIGDQIRGLAFGAILFGAVTWRRSPGPFLRSTAALGVVSYGLYLWHWVVIHGIELAIGRASPLSGPLATPAAVAVALIATLPFAILSWKLVESPCIRLAARVNRRTTARGTVAFALEAD